MNSFPLYDTIKKKLIDKDITIAQLKKIEKVCNELDFTKHELIYMLIKSYSIECNDTSISGLPFNGFIQSNELYFDISSFPNQLKKILYTFIILDENNKQ
jgi:hypothetical protein